jgi:hypothetical protein
MPSNNQQINRLEALCLLSRAGGGDQLSLELLVVNSSAQVTVT